MAFGGDRNEARPLLCFFAHRGLYQSEAEPLAAEEPSPPKAVERSAGTMNRYRAQEQEPSDKPDIRRPPDREIPEFEDGEPDQPTTPGAPPFTGEDVERIPRPDPPLM
jgi:hypothetical protein